MLNAFKPYLPVAFDNVDFNPPVTYSVEELTRDVDIKPLHSHNDYWRKRPLFDALSHGCQSIESDIWKFEEDYQVKTDTESTVFSGDELYVGHNQSTNPNITNLDKSVKHGIFYNSPETPLYFWIDIKLDAEATFKKLMPKLQRFIDNDYLSYYDQKEDTYVERPLIVILTGNLPKDLVKSQDKVYTFLDAPLSEFTTLGEDELTQYSKLSKIASASMSALLGHERYKTGNLMTSDLDTLEKYFKIAHEYGIKTRIWGGIDWPKNLVYKHNMNLIELGCDLINANDLNFGSQLFDA